MLMREKTIKYLRMNWHKSKCAYRNVFILSLALLKPVLKSAGYFAKSKMLSWAGNAPNSQGWCCVSLSPSGNQITLPKGKVTKVQTSLICIQLLTSVKENKHTLERNPGLEFKNLKQFCIWPDTGVSERMCYPQFERALLVTHIIMEFNKDILSLSSLEQLSH